jgi:Stage II sporulation protein E (SpoIIE)
VNVPTACGAIDFFEPQDLFTPFPLSGSSVDSPKEPFEMMNETPPVTPGKRKRIFIALASAIVVSLAANGIELLVIRLVRPSEQALTWVSDVVIAVVLAVAVYLRLDLQATRMRLSRVEQEQIVADTELSLAAEIQSGRLPKTPSAGSGISWAARLRQARKIGGDFYDFVQVNPKRWFVILGDVSGKGVPAALLVASVQTLFRGLSQTTDDPAEVLRALSKGIHDETQGSMFVTCVVGLFDLEKRMLTYVNAGHPPGLIVNHSKVTLLESVGPPVGMFAGWRHKAVTIPLHEGDIGVLVTDGVSESIETDGVCWYELARAALADLKRPTAEQVCHQLMKMAQDGPGPAGVTDWEDDQTAVVFVVEGGAAAYPDEGEVS